MKASSPHATSLSARQTHQFIVVTCGLLVRYVDDRHEPHITQLIAQRFPKPFKISSTLHC